MTLAQYAACSEIFDNERRVLDAQFAFTRLLLAEPNRDKKKKNQPFETEDFMLFSEKKQAAAMAAKKKEPMTWEAQKAYVVSFLDPFFKVRANLEKNKGNN